MALPARRQRAGGPAERRFPGWTGDPLAEFDDLFQRMGHLVESTIGGGTTATGAPLWSPSADIYETDDAYTIEADLPGIKPDDIDIEVSERELIINGEIKEREHEGLLRRSTRRTGRFEYRAVLPSDVNAEKVGATLDDGVLRVTVPKAEAARPRHVEIRSEKSQKSGG